MVSVAVTTEESCCCGASSTVIIYHVEPKAPVSEIKGAANVSREPDPEMSCFIHKSSAGALGKLNVPSTSEKSGTLEWATEVV